MKPPFLRPLCLALVALVLVQTTIASQTDLVRELAARVEQCFYKTNDAGDVVVFSASCHPVHRRGTSKEPKPGLRDEDIARLVDACPALETVFLEFQPLTNAGYAHLARLRNLTDLRLHYMNHTVWTKPDSPTFVAPVLSDEKAPLFVNNLARPLRVFQLKHNFAIRKSCMAELKPQPELEMLELDTGYAMSDSVPFIIQSPKIRNLQMHRTQITDADLATIAAHLPDLEVLELRPQGKTPLTPASLKALSSLRKLRVLRTSLDWKGMTYENGLEHLVGIKSLEFVGLGFPVPPEEVRKLHEARPDLKIGSPGLSFDGAHAGKEFDIDAEWRLGTAPGVKEVK